DDVERRWPAEPSEAVQPTVVDVARRQFLNGPLDGRQGEGPDVAREVVGTRIAGALGDRAVVESHAEGLADRSGHVLRSLAEVDEDFVCSHHLRATAIEIGRAHV